MRQKYRKADTAPRRRPDGPCAPACPSRRARGADA